MDFLTDTLRSPLPPSESRGRFSAFVRRSPPVLQMCRAASQRVPSRLWTVSKGVNNAPTLSVLVIPRTLFRLYAGKSPPSAEVRTVAPQVRGSSAVETIDAIKGSNHWLHPFRSEGHQRASRLWTPLQMCRAASQRKQTATVWRIDFTAASQRVPSRLSTQSKGLGAETIQQPASEIYPQ